MFFDHHTVVGMGDGLVHLPTKISCKAEHLANFFQYPRVCPIFVSGDAHSWN